MLTSPLIPTPPLALVSQTRVPNEPAKYIHPEYRLAIVGEAPGAEEEVYGRPFVGASGNLLNSLLSSSGVDRNCCFVGNVCKFRPPGNDITVWGHGHPKVLEGASELWDEVSAFNPNCILLLGNTPLHFATGLSGVSSWRGSILSTPHGKVVPALHPAAVLREYSSWPLLRFDIQRAFEESRTPTLTLPKRTLQLDLSADEICNYLDNWPTGQLLSFDIEGGIDAFPCCSVAGTSDRGFIIAWSRHDELRQGRIAQSLSRMLYRSDIPKVLQNSLYDRFVLAYRYHMLIRGVVEDTMLKHWEIYPESSGKKDDETGKAKQGMGKNLGVITSIWTREPHYKSDLMIYSQAELKRQIQAGTYDPNQATNNKYKGCILDSCVTLEACLAMDGALTPPAARHYRFNVELLSPLLYMELKGFVYAKELAAAELSSVQNALAECGSRLSVLTQPFKCGKKDTLITDLRGTKGSISSQRLTKYLYEVRSFPPQYSGRGTDKKLTADVDALLKLSKKFPNDPLLSNVLLHRKLEGVRETLEVQTDPDGRVRCGYNLVGTETGRLTCYTSPTGSGANLQTITKKLRKLYRADEGYWLFQCDLAGADGWTVAAHCLRHGDSTMWDDYHYGLKPAKIICLMKQGVLVGAMTRQELGALCDKESKPGGVCDSDSWDYFGCKRVQHMTNYAGQSRTGVKQIMLDSYNITGKAFFMTEQEFESLQRLYFSRYPGLYAWHRWAKNEVSSGHNLASASGHTRTFFGRRKSYQPKTKSWEADHDTWKEFLADEPQENTTYATNLALHRLWHDPENRQERKDEAICTMEQRTSEGLPRDYRARAIAPSDNLANSRASLIIQPIHQVHDALIGQFPKSCTEWAIGKIRSYFDNELEIANSKVVIPFDGAYGPSWGELGEKYGGGKI